MPVLYLLIFLSATAGLLGVALMLLPNRVGVRLRTLAGPAGGPEWTTTLAQLVGPFANLSTPEGDWERSPLRLRFLNAGIRRADARLIFFGVKTVLPVVLAVPAWMALRGATGAGGLTLLFYVLMAALAGCYLPNIYVWWRARRRKREVFESFPDAADLLLVCVEAGLGLDAALTRVAEEMRRKSRALAEELQLTNLEMRAGATREKSLRNLALRTGLEEIGVFAAMLSQAEKFGTSIGDSLRVFSDDLRHKRLMRAEELAAKVPTKMLIPLVTCIFPAVVMVVLGPAIIGIIRNVLPLIARSH
ncbi:MAG: type II secretion system F family protein [Telluria sp.]